MASAPRAVETWRALGEVVIERGLGLSDSRLAIGAAGPARLIQGGN